MSSPATAEQDAIKPTSTVARTFQWHGGHDDAERNGNDTGLPGDGHQWIGPEWHRRAGESLHAVVGSLSLCRTKWDELIGRVRLRARSDACSSGIWGGIAMTPSSQLEIHKSQGLDEIVPLHEAGYMKPGTDCSEYGAHTWR